MKHTSPTLHVEGKTAKLRPPELHSSAQLVGEPSLNPQKSLHVGVKAAGLREINEMS